MKIFQSGRTILRLFAHVKGERVCCRVGNWPQGGEERRKDEPSVSEVEQLWLMRQKGNLKSTEKTGTYFYLMAGDAYSATGKVA